MPDSAGCSRYAALPYDSTLTFEARSSLHPVHGKATNLTGYVDAAWSDDGLRLEPPPAMHVEVPVERLRSGNDLQDREMRKLVDSRRNPSIVADLAGVRPTGTPNRFAADGDITLAGRTHRYSGEMAVTLAGNRITVEGDLRVDIRDFGLQPPKVLFLKVEPQVNVHLRLIAARQ
ncbi:MAG: YceI family protein [Vulcanimicrobiaceae bacterium]